MNEQERRREILKAEEAIRQLAAEMVSASKSAAQAKEVGQKLEKANEAVREAKEALDQAARLVAASGDKSQAAVTSASKEAVKALSEATEQTDKIGKQITVAIDRLQAAAQAVERSPQKVAEVLDSQLSRLTSLVRWALIFAALAVVGAGVSVVLLVVRTG